jgi:hypothetical protein
MSIRSRIAQAVPGLRKLVLQRNQLITERDGLLRSLQASEDAVKELNAQISDREKRIRSLLEQKAEMSARLAGAYREVDAIRADYAPRKLFVIGFARSGTTILMDILNSAKDVLILSEFNAFMLDTQETVFSHYPGETVFQQFVSRKETEIRLPYKGAVVDDYGQWKGSQAFFEELGRKYRIVGDKIAISGKRADLYGELEMLDRFLGEHSEAAQLFLFRRPDEILKSWTEKHPVEALDAAATLAESWILFIRRYLKSNLGYALFHKDIGPELVPELERVFGVKFDIVPDLIGQRFQKTNAGCEATQETVSAIPNMEMLQKAYDDLLEAFAVDPRSIKSARTESLMKALTPIVYDLVTFVLSLGDRGKPAHHINVLRRFERSVAQFEPCEPRKPIVLLTHPKTGTMGVRNLILHYVGRDRLSPEMLYGDLEGVKPYRLEKEFVYGHIAYSEAMAERFKDRLKVLVLRDPVSIVVSFARSLLDPRQARPDQAYFEETGTSLLELIPLVVSGYTVNGWTLMPFAESYAKFLADWREHADVVVDYDDLLGYWKDLKRGGVNENAREFVASIVKQVPEDWEDRFILGLDPSQSSTYMPHLDPAMKKEAVSLAKKLLIEAGIVKVTGAPGQT